MVEGRSSLGFLKETALTLGVGGQTGRQNFYCHQTIEPAVLRLVDFAHSAGANLVDQLVVKDLFADHGANGALRRIMTRMRQPAQSGPWPWRPGLGLGLGIGIGDTLSWITMRFIDREE